MADGSHPPAENIFAVELIFRHDFPLEQASSRDFRRCSEDMTAFVASKWEYSEVILSVSRFFGYIRNFWGIFRCWKWQFRIDEAWLLEVWGSWLILKLNWRGDAINFIDIFLRINKIAWEIGTRFKESALTVRFWDVLTHLLRYFEFCGGC